MPLLTVLLACSSRLTIGGLAAPDPGEPDGGTDALLQSIPAAQPDQGAPPWDTQPDLRMPQGSNCPAQISTPFCTELLPLLEIPRENWRDKNILPKDVWAKYAVAYHPQGIYLWVHVNDPTRNPSPTGSPAFCGDAVHVFVDTDGRYANPPQYDIPGTRQFQAAAPSNDLMASMRGDVYGWEDRVGSWTGGRFVAAPVKDGYVLEAFIGAQDMGVANFRPAAGGSAGFSVSVTLGVPGGGACDRLGDFALLLDRTLMGGNDPVSPHKSTNAFCNPRLRP
jgi:hypothetical protein